MEIKQYGSALGHKIILSLYNLLGYKFVSFILNFVALYYVVFTHSTKKSLKSYYEHLGLKLTYLTYFIHIKMFALSIFDRFVSRIKPDELTFTRENREAFLSLNDGGGVVLLSHIGGWATAANILTVDIPVMHIVMNESTKKEISDIENAKQRGNETGVRIIDLNKGAISANVQIANALINNEVVAMMADRVTDKSKVLQVKFLGAIVNINKNPFDIAYRLKKNIITAFVVNTKEREYALIFNKIDINNKTLEEVAREYANILEDIVKKHPNQWYNFYDFFDK